jgi:hypothetical protein
MQQIGDIYGMAGTLHNMGGILFERNDFEGAAPYFIQAYQIFYQIGSPNAKVPKSYLQSIIERIGEAKYQEIIAKME